MASVHHAPVKKDPKSWSLRAGRVNVMGVFSTGISERSPTTDRRCAIVVLQSVRVRAQLSGAAGVGSRVTRLASGSPKLFSSWH